MSDSKKMRWVVISNKTPDKDEWIVDIHIRRDVFNEYLKSHPSLYAPDSQNVVPQFDGIINGRRTISMLTDRVLIRAEEDPLCIHPNKDLDSNLNELFGSQNEE